MDSYGKGLVFAAALLGSIAMSAVLVAGPRGSAAEADPTAASAPQTEAAVRTAEEPETAPALAADGADTGGTEENGAVEEEILVPVMAGANAGIPAQTEATPCYSVFLMAQAGQTVELRDLTGSTLQQTTADESGYAVLAPIAPGCYTLRQGAYGGDFRLAENAAVEALSGTLWSDGELLHLEQAETVSLTVECRIRPEDRGRVVTLSLTDRQGNCIDRSFVAGTEERCEVAFLGLAPGHYALRQNGKLLRTLTVTGAAEQFLSLLD